MHINLLRRTYWQIRSIPLQLLKLFFSVSPLTNNIKKILIISLSRIGDSVYTTPVLREIKSYYKNAEIDLICSPYNSDILKNNPHIKEFFVLGKGCLGFFKFLQMLKKRNYDLTIDTTADDKLPGAVLACFSNSNYRMGFDVEKRGFCFDKKVKRPKEKIHASDIFLSLLKSINIPVNSNKPEIFITEQEKLFAENILKEHGLKKADFLVCIHPGANFPSQMLKSNKWAEFIDLISTKYSVKPVLLGNIREKLIISEIKKNLKNNIAIIDNITSLRELMAFINMFKIFAGNNSGPLHIAAALNIPTLSWMGPTIPYRWHPLGEKNNIIRNDIDCSPCNRGICTNHKCEELITLIDLEKEFSNLLKETNY